MHQPGHLAGLIGQFNHLHGVSADVVQTYQVAFAVCPETQPGNGAFNWIIPLELPGLPCKNQERPGLKGVGMIDQGPVPVNVPKLPSQGADRPA